MGEAPFYRWASPLPEFTFMTWLAAWAGSMETRGEVPPPAWHDACSEPPWVSILEEQDHFALVSVGLPYTADSWGPDYSLTVHVPRTRSLWTLAAWLRVLVRINQLHPRYSIVARPPSEWLPLSLSLCVPLRAPRHVWQFWSRVEYRADGTQQQEYH